MRTVRYNLTVQHPSDWHNNEGVIRQAEEQGMGIILMRPLTSGVFQRLMAEAWAAVPAAIEIDTVFRDGAGRAPLAAHLRVFRSLRGRGAGRRARNAGRGTRRGEPRFVDLNNEISDDVASRIDLVALHDRYVP